MCSTTAHSEGSAGTAWMAGLGFSFTALSAACGMVARAVTSGPLRGPRGICWNQGGKCNRAFSPVRETGRPKDPRFSVEG